MSGSRSANGAEQRNGADAVVPERTSSFVFGGFWAILFLSTFVVAGDGKNLLVRGIGPGLAPCSISAPILRAALRHLWQAQRQLKLPAGGTKTSAGGACALGHAPV